MRKFSKICDNYKQIFSHAERVAVKILDKTKVDEKTQRLLSREIQSMDHLRHPNIIRLYEVLSLQLQYNYCLLHEFDHLVITDGELVPEH